MNSFELCKNIINIAGFKIFLDLISLVIVVNHFSSHDCYLFSGQIQVGHDHAPMFGILTRFVKQHPSFVIDILNRRVRMNFVNFIEFCEDIVDIFGFKIILDTMTRLGVVDEFSRHFLFLF